MPLPVPRYLHIKVVRARALQSLFTIVWSDVSFLFFVLLATNAHACWWGGQQPVLCSFAPVCPTCSLSEPPATSSMLMALLSCFLTHKPTVSDCWDFCCVHDFKFIEFSSLLFKWLRKHLNPNSNLGKKNGSSSLHVVLFIHRPAHIWF